jgi:hypothetical protein
LRLEQTGERLLGVGEDAFPIRLQRKILFAEVVLRFEGLDQERGDAEGEEKDFLGDPRARCIGRPREADLQYP